MFLSDKRSSDNDCDKNEFGAFFGHCFVHISFRSHSSVFSNQMRGNAASMFNKIDKFANGMNLRNYFRHVLETCSLFSYASKRIYAAFAVCVHLLSS